MVLYLRAGYEPGSSVLNTLESGEKMIGNAVQLSLSIVKARCHVRVFFFTVKMISNSSIPTVVMEMCHATNMLHMVVHT